MKLGGFRYFRLPNEVAEPFYQVDLDERLWTEEQQLTLEPEACTLFRGEEATMKSITQRYMSACIIVIALNILKCLGISRSPSHIAFSQERLR